MAEFCKQCAKDLGFSETDLVPSDGLPGYYYTSLCEGCGPTMVNHRGECTSIDCMVPGHCVGPEENLLLQCNVLIPLPENIELDLIESGVSLDIPISHLIFESFDEITLHPTYKYYLIQPNGTYSVYKLKES